METDIAMWFASSSRAACQVGVGFETDYLLLSKKESGFEIKT